MYNCSVCAETMVSDIIRRCPVVLLHCGHAFHIRCLLEWFVYSSAERRPTCPTCRLNPTRVIYLAANPNDTDELKCIKCSTVIQEENAALMVLDCGHILHEICLNLMPHGPFAQEYGLRKCPDCGEYSAGVTIWFH